jgi:hypothetical protein
MIAAKRLLNGDILFLTLMEKAKIKLKKSNEWLRAVAPIVKV